VPNGKAVNQYGASIKEQLYQLEKLFNSELNHLRALIEHEKELRISYEKAVEKAFEIYSKENERRMGETNNFRAEYTIDRSEFLKKDAHEAFKEAIEIRMSASEKLAASAAATLVGKASGISTAQLWLGFVVIASVIIAVVGAILGGR